MKFFTQLPYLQARAAFYGESLPSDRNVYIALSMLAFNPADLNAVNVSSVASFHGHEFDGSSYARQLVSILTITKDGTFHTWNARTNSANFGVLGAGASSAKWALLYMGSTASPSGDGSAIPLGAIDNKPLFPFNGNGTKKQRVKWESKGVFYGPNCEPTTNIALTMSDQLFMAQNFR